MSALCWAEPKAQKPIMAANIKLNFMFSKGVHTPHY